MCNIEIEKEEMERNIAHEIRLGENRNTHRKIEGDLNSILK